MFKRTIALGALCALAFAAHAQISDSLKSVQVEKPVIVESTKADDKTPMAFTNLTKKDLDKLNLGQDVPYLLRFTPSLVATSDAGTGIGYTGLWIRGSDPSRINVTINGVPLNDPESQQVFWVNLPDFASGTTKVQVQRGVGTSTNGAGAFGGTIKLETTNNATEPYAEFINGAGSFNTMRNTFRFGTGLLSHHWTIEGRLSNIQSQGYVDRGSAKLHSAFLSASYLGKRTIIRFTGFTGREDTYQAWWGTPAARLSGNADSLQTFISNNGLSADETANLLNSGRTYNYYTYPNQIDHYGQDHAQLHLARGLGKSGKFNLNAALHYTKGKGYFEEYKAAQSFGRYGLSSLGIAQDTVTVNGLDDNGNVYNTTFNSMFTNSDVGFNYQVLTNSAGDTLRNELNQPLYNALASIDHTDLVRRRWLNNDFYGGIFSISHSTKKVQTVLGGAYNEYRGKHYGELIWMKYTNGVQNNYRYYNGTSLKRDANVYLKSTYSILPNLSVYGDLQLRDVNYSTSGLDNDLVSYRVKDHLVFFNPKAGISFSPNKYWSMFVSYAVANKEPNRNDYVDAPDGVTPKSERLNDLEIGLKYRWLNLNLYNMVYHDQLVLTGAVNDVGSALRTNVSRSFRRGVELMGNWSWKDKLLFNANLTLSENRIQKFSEKIPDYLNGGEMIVEHTNAPISFSPSIIAGGSLTWVLLSPAILESVEKSGGKGFNPGLNVTWLSRHVGKQYLDNTGNDYRSIADYWVNDVRLELSNQFSSGTSLSLQFILNNALNRKYSTNGYTYSYAFGGLYNERFYYPQATRNALMQLVFKF